MRLSKVEIYFWEGMGECKPETCQFRLEVVDRGDLEYYVGTPATLRKILRKLETWGNVKFPKVSWKAIVGNDEDGGTAYKWSNKKGTKNG